MSKPFTFNAVKSSADASSGELVPLYRQGTSTEYTLNAGTLLKVTDISIVWNAAGLVHLKFDGGPTIFKGTFAAAGGVVRTFKTAVIGEDAQNLIIIAPVGQVDVQIQGELIGGQ